MIDLLPITEYLPMFTVSRSPLIIDFGITTAYLIVDQTNNLLCTPSVGGGGNRRSNLAVQPYILAAT